MDNSLRFQRLEELKRWAFMKYSARLKAKSVCVEKARKILGYRDSRYVRKLALEGWLERYAMGKKKIGRIMTVSIIAFMKARMEEAGVSPYLADDEIEATLIRQGLL